MSKLSELFQKQEQVKFEIQKQQVIEESERQRLQLIENAKIAEDNQKKQDASLVETLSPLYKELEAFLAKDTDPKLIWLFVALLDNKTPQTVSRDGYYEGGTPMFNKQELLRNLEIIKRAKDKGK